MNKRTKVNFYVKKKYESDSRDETSIILYYLNWLTEDLKIEGLEIVEEVEYG